MLEQISNLQAYFWAFIVLAASFLLAVLFSNLVSYKPHDTGATKRRIIFWIMAILTCSVSFLVNYSIAVGIHIGVYRSDFIMHAGIASGAAFLLFIIVGFMISKIFPNTKCGTWF